jgi:hypothetical protein
MLHRAPVVCDSLHTFRPSRTAIKVMPRLSNAHPLQTLKPACGNSELHGCARLTLAVKFPFPTHAADDCGGLIVKILKTK